MDLELILRFATLDRVEVSFDGVSATVDFVSPLQEDDLQELRWYLETYAAGYTADVDDQRAQRVAAQLKRWGEALYRAVFHDETIEPFIEFRNVREAGRVVTIQASHPAVLSLPWELLHTPQGGYLFNEKPRISIRRNLAQRGGRSLQKVATKERLRLLFVVSRPEGAGFLNPRLEPQAVLQALAGEGIGQIEVEFLRPATLQKLIDRLENEQLPAIDILHFDGHGEFDADGQLHEKAKQGLPSRFAGVKTDTSDAATGKNMGYLLFEDEQGKEAHIAADRLGELLHQQQLGLVVLSACQSSTVAGEDAFGSVAARLTQTGIPGILAMPYSVLITTTRTLFAEFYKQLATGKGIGASLDNARRTLLSNPYRGDRARMTDRGIEQVSLNLEDWFVPTLYQSGQDTPLLQPSTPLTPPPSSPSSPTNLPPLPEVGFFGRSWELWQIERAFVRGTRRLTIHGFGGQGKTALAQEAGRWLQQTGLFQRVCFVDYAQFQGVDAVSLAVATLATVLGQNLLDANAATAALTVTPTLVILDNLESLAVDPLRELLDAGKAWSDAGKSRLLLTSRTPDFRHPDYATQGTRLHLALPLQGLGSEPYPDDALAYLQALMALPPAPLVEPPKRHGLIELCKLVDFHPLSLALLAPQLKTRRVAEVGNALERLLEESRDVPDKDRSLIASLKLSLERLDTNARAWLPNLGVFQGGAFEDDLLAITGLGKTPQEFACDQSFKQLRQFLDAQQSGDSTTAAQRFQVLPIDEEQGQQLASIIEQISSLPPTRELIEGVDESIWQTLRQQLEATGLIQVEALPGGGVPYLKFHPTLAPALWAEVSPDTQQALLSRHHRRYYELSNYLYNEDNRNPDFARAIARRELPNLLFAVRGAIDAQEDWAIDFVTGVNKFLSNFGLTRDLAALSQQAASLPTTVGSYDWFLARTNEAEQLRTAGRAQEAAQHFEYILTELGTQPSYQRCVTLRQLGDCLKAQRQLSAAAHRYREALAVADQLDASDTVKRQKGSVQTDLADVLRDMGDYAGAKAAYEAALVIDEEVGGDLRGTAVTQGQLGTLALVQGNLTEAEQRYREALAIFQRLHEPVTEAIFWHQLGMMYEDAQEWQASEQAYRRAAALNESVGNRLGAAKTWSQLAVVSVFSGNLQEAEAWCHKALTALQAEGDFASSSLVLYNLAAVLQQQPERLSEARQLAEESLKIKQTLDPAAAELWKTYTILAVIAEQQQQPDQAQTYRRLARQSKADWHGTRYELQPFVPLIAGVVAATIDSAMRQESEPALEAWKQQGWQTLVAAIRQILAGERNEDALCAALNLKESMVVLAILAGIADPATVEALRVEEE